MKGLPSLLGHNDI